MFLLFVAILYHVLVLCGLLALYFRSVIVELVCLIVILIFIFSCDKVTWLEERNFWLFEGSVFIVGVISTTVVFTRQKVLDHRMLRRIQRQLASGV